MEKNSVLRGIHTYMMYPVGGGGLMGKRERYWCLC